MEQRRLRLGDILDDYCPRERRVTNHVVVAMIEDEIKQTRCTTCDAEHPYKGGKAPRRKKARERRRSAAHHRRHPSSRRRIRARVRSTHRTRFRARTARSCRRHAGAEPRRGVSRRGAGPSPADPGDVAAARRDQDRASASRVHDSAERHPGQRELPRRLRGQRSRRARCWRTRWERRRSLSAAVRSRAAGVRGARAHSGGFGRGPKKRSRDFRPARALAAAARDRRTV